MGVVRGSRGGGARLLSEELFRGALIRERKRADRSNQAMAVVLVELAKDHGAPGSGWRAIVDALGAAKRETDVLGWFSRSAAVGLILAELPRPVDDFVEQFRARVEHQLAQRLSTDAAHRVSVQFHLHTPDAPGREDVPSLDPILSRLNTPDERRTVQAALKRGLDVFGSLTLLTLLAPLLALIAVLVKATSRGPIFFRQARIGANARPFTMLKFRSMRVDGGESLHQEYVSWFIKSSGKTGGAASGEAVFKIAHDPRVTPVGRLLRKTSLDELPQLWNVLRGEMSLVGPRPPLQYEVDQYQPWHRRRVLEAKPGITGLWQVTGRSRTTFDDMVRLDLRYAKSCSFWTDVKILLATPGVVLGGKGAR
jgi:lipopolysaccharide/colanic/teichoic acid biosynthesis glycosyltransferase